MNSAINKSKSCLPSGVQTRAKTKVSSIVKSLHTNKLSKPTPEKLSPKVTTKPLTLNESLKSKPVTSNTQETQTDLFSLNKLAETQTSISTITIARTDELLGKKWLTDGTIQAYFEILNSCILSSYRAVAINPVLSHAIKCVDDFKHFVEPHNLVSKDFIIIPVNDSVVLDQAGGSHWSVLFYSKHDHHFYHYDSVNNFNESHAKLIAKKLSSFLKNDESEPRFTSVKGPQQSNGYDCGVYMICVTEVLICDIVKSGKFDILNIKNLSLSESDLITKRSCIAYVINNTFMSNQTLQELITKPTNYSQSNNKPVECLASIPVNSRPITSSHTGREPDIKESWSRVSNPSKKNQKGQQAVVKAPPHFYSENPFGALQNIVDNEPNTTTPSKQTTLKNRTQSTSLPKFSQSKEKSNKIYKGQKTHVSSYKNTNEQNTISSVTIIGDSHSRGLAEILKAEACGKVQISGITKPNAKLSHLKRDILNLDKSSVLVLCAGANNAYGSDLGDVLHSLRAVLLKIRSNAILLIGVPLRRDLPLSHLINRNIFYLNLFLNDLAGQIRNCEFVDISLLPKQCYSQDCVHLTYAGKKHLCNKIMKSTLLKTHFSLPTTGHKFQSKGSATSIETATQLPSPSLPSGITVLEDKMKNIFKKVKNNTSVALAHTISSDFDHPRHMSAGVAVAFREEYGRPKTSDMIHSRLACQKVLGGPTVYSLVTKNQFSGKPNEADYDEAFEQLKTDFQRNKFSTLICSAMGCVRDLIKLQHFVKNIVDFHQQTGAQVIIVSYDQKARRKLWRGLDHHEFVNTLKGLIASNLPIKDITARQNQLTVSYTSTPYPVRSNDNTAQLPDDYSSEDSILSQSVVSDLSQSSVSECVVEAENTQQELSSPATSTDATSTPNSMRTPEHPDQNSSLQSRGSLSPCNGFTTPSTEKLDYLTSNLNNFLGSMSQFPPLGAK